MHISVVLPAKNEAKGLTRTLLLNCRRAAVELGWRSRYGAAEVLAAT